MVLCAKVNVLPLDNPSKQNNPDQTTTISVPSMFYTGPPIRSPFHLLNYPSRAYTLCRNLCAFEGE